MICTVHHILLTNSMEQSPSWKAASHSASQEILLPLGLSTKHILFG
jgi:hypothetical protein